MQDIPRSRPQRVLAAAVTLALIAGLAACGSDKGSSGSGPAPTAAPNASDLGLAIAPASYNDPYAGALAAAAQAPAAAELLAKGFASADKVSGDLATPAADLAAQLTALLATHVYAVGSAVSTMFATARHSPQSDAAWAAVDANSKSFIKLVESLQAEADGKVGSGGRGTSRVLPAAPTPPPVGPLASPLASPAAGPAAKPTTPPPSNPGSRPSTKATPPTKPGGSGSPSPSPTATEPPFNLDAYDFGKAWRDHVDSLTDYAQAARGNDTSGEKDARRALDTWASQAGQFFRAITHSRVSSYAVRTDLGKYLDAITSAIDGIADKEGESFVKVREGADLMPAITQQLAAGLASATDRKGDVTDDATTLRDDLTAALTGHSFLTVMSFQVAFAQPGKAGLVSAQYRRVQVSLDDNSKQIAAHVADAAGPIKEAEFLQGWRIHLRDFENYTRSLQVGDLDGRKTAADALNSYLDTVSAYLANVTKHGVDAKALEKRLRTQVADILGVIDALATAFPG